MRGGEHGERPGQYDSQIGEYYKGWGHMERSLVNMIAKLIHNKPSVQQEIVREEMVADSIIVEALTKSVSFLHRLWELTDT